MDSFGLPDPSMTAAEHPRGVAIGLRFGERLGLLTPDVALRNRREAARRTIQCAYDVLDAGPKGTDRLRAALRELHDALEGAMVAEAVRASVRRYAADHLQDELARLQEAADGWRRALQSDARALGSLGTTLVTAEQACRQGLREAEPGDRGELLRDARRSLDEVVRDDAGSTSGTAWALLAGVRWALSQNVAETRSAYENAVKGYADGTGTPLADAYRALADLAAIAEEPSAAFALSLLAAEAEPTAETLTFLAVDAARAGRAADAWKPVECGIARDPWLAVCVLARSDLAEFHPPVIERLELDRGRLLSDAGQALSLWQETVAKVHRACETIGASAALMGELEDGYDRFRKGLSEESVFGLRAIVEAGHESSQEVLSAGTFAVNRNHRECTDLVRAARDDIERAWEERERMIAANTVRESGEVQQAQNAVEGSAKEGEAAQRGCAWGVGAGCAVFCIYTFGVAALGIKAADAGWSSPIGIAAIIGTVVPVGLAILGQITWGLKRAALEARLNAAKAEVRRAVEAARHLADETYKAKVQHRREELTDAESKLQKAEMARELLVEAPREAA